MTRTMTLAAVLCLVALAAADAAIAPKVATSLKPQAPNSEMDAVTIPRMLSYQGKLTDTLGSPVPNGSYSVAFRLYTVPSGGSSFWNETQSVTTKSGLFSALLGSVTPIASLPDAGALYLGMAASGGAELTPRLRLASSAYSYLSERSASTDLLQGKDTTALDARYVNEAQANSVTSAMITNGTIAAADLNQMGAATNQVLKWTGSAWAARSDSVGGGDNAWVRGGDSVLYTIRRLGIARGGSDNMLHGNEAFTHVNLGVACTTGLSGQNFGYATVGGGYQNTASGYSATVGGGYQNTASVSYATVAGGYQNTASASYATVAGGVLDTSAATYSFTTGYGSVVPSGFSNSAAFNGQRATASNQTRVGALSKASGTFTIDHPVDPHGKILNHYFIEGPEMLNIYRGSIVLDASGRAEVRLPDYFDALNRNPHVQLTGVGTFEVYVAEKVVGNRFIIGGKPGTDVFWTVTGERKDVSAEITRRLMPVEQPKSGELAGVMLDDDFLRGAMDQLDREGKTQGIDFRTAGGRQRYEKMRQLIEHR